MIGVKINDICWSPKPSMDMNWQAPGSQYMAAQGTHNGFEIMMAQVSASKAYLSADNQMLTAHNSHYCQ